jgi:hypothetical protein
MQVRHGGFRGIVLAVEVVVAEAVEEVAYFLTLEEGMIVHQAFSSRLLIKIIIEQLFVPIEIFETSLMI